MSRKKKAEQITTTRKKCARSRKGTADKPRDFYDEKKSGGRAPVDEPVFAEEVARIHTGRPLRGRLKGYAE